MAHAAAEAPAAYVLATQFHETVREILDELDEDHDYLALELLKYAERIMGNVGAAEAPYAAEHRQLHYQMAFSALCGCAAASAMLVRLRLCEEDRAKRATRLLASLAALVRPIAEEGMDPRSEDEEAVLDSILESLEDEEPWRDDDEEDGDAW